MAIRRVWALPAVPLYWFGIKTKALVAKRDAQRLLWPVISVGSLSAGGAGKTPVVMMLAKLLEKHEVEVDVLSRGYGRGSEEVLEVDPEGDAAKFGDEPVEMARAGLRVFVGGERFAAGEMAEAADPAHPQKGKDFVGQPVHVLDDGFQHRQLRRSLDVAVVTLADVQDWLLPAGNLREPLTALRRADIAVVREDEQDGVAAALHRYFDGEVWLVRRVLALPAAMPERPLAFCGIARPEGFFAMVPGAVGRVSFGDHYRYEAKDFARLVREAKKCGADGFVTTAKDAVKLTAAIRAVLAEVGPVAVAQLRVELVDEDAAWERLRHHVGVSVHEKMGA